MKGKLIPFVDSTSSRNKIQATPGLLTFFLSVLPRGRSVCLHLPIVGPSTTLCFSRLLASVHCPGVLSRPGESFRSTLEMVWLVGEQPVGGLTHLLTNDWRAFSCPAALLRNSCLSRETVFQVWCLFVCICFSKSLCLSSETEGL